MTQLAIESAPAIPEIRTKEKTLPVPPQGKGKTYYHVTTPENAAKIATSGMMSGGKWEGGYIYAWKVKPNRYASENSGAHLGVTISFKTSAVFVDDIGIEYQKVKAFGPVVTALPGPILVWDVQIVG